MVVVVSGSGTTLVGGLEGTVVVIVGSGAGATILGILAGTVVVVGRSAGGSSSCDCCNRRSFNWSRIIIRETSGMIGRDKHSCCSCQYRCIVWYIK